MLTSETLMMKRAIILCKKESKYHSVTRWSNLLAREVLLRLFLLLITKQDHKSQSKSTETQNWITSLLQMKLSFFSTWWKKIPTMIAILCACLTTWCSENTIALSLSSSILTYTSTWRRTTCRASQKIKLRTMPNSCSKPLSFWRREMLLIVISSQRILYAPILTGVFWKLSILVLGVSQKTNLSPMYNPGTIEPLKSY